MQSITFAVPTLTTAQMTRQDQIDVSVNQATAALVCCYLEHMNAAISKGISGAQTTTGGTDLIATGPLAQGVTSTPSDTAFITTTEFINLINSVQTALRTVA